MFHPKYSTEFALNTYSSSLYVLQPNKLKKFVKDERLRHKLSGFHIYFVCRRPRVILNPQSIKSENDSIVGELSFLSENNRVTREFKISKGLFAVGISDASSSLDCKNLDLYTAAKKKVLSVQISELLMKFPSSILSPDCGGLEKLKVLYIGQSYGEDGERHIFERLKKHETLQQILTDQNEEFPDDELQILLFYFPQPQLMMAMDGKATARLSDEEDSAHVQKVLQTELSNKQLVSVIEASLIRYFKPEYNELYKEHFPKRRHTILQQCYDLDFCSIATTLETQGLGLSLYTRYVEPRSEHVAIFDLHTESDRKTFFMLMKPDIKAA